MIALLEAQRAGLFARRYWLPNIVAGLIVGIVALPLAMAFAIASGARPEQGIYTAIVGGGLITLLGGSRVQIAGPTGAFIAILLGITTHYGIAGLQIATLMAGVILLLMGMARMGAVIRFIPVPVIVGFTAGIGVIIFIGQWPDFFGLPKPSGEHFHEKLWHLLQSLPEIHGPTLLLSMIGVALVLLAPRVKGLARVPGPLVAMVVVTIGQTLYPLPGIATIGSAFGGIPTGLPSLTLPELSLSQVITLIGPAFTIAMLGAIEALLSAVVADGMAGTRHDANQELIGQGIANVVVPLLGGFAATGAIARTATNVRNGANSPLAGITHALVLVAVLLFLAPLASSIPLAVLAAILFVVAWNMSELPRCVQLLRTAPAADKVILIITFGLTVFADLVVAVNVGVILAILQFLRRMSDSVEIQAADPQSLARELSQQGLTPLPSDVLVYDIAGPMFFGAVDNFEQALSHTHMRPRVLVIRLRQMPFIDMTGIQALQDTARRFGKQGVTVIFCEANARVLGKLERTGVVGSQGALYFTDFPVAVKQATGKAEPVTL